jgi:hypothetical protein
LCTTADTPLAATTRREVLRAGLAAGALATPFAIRTATAQTSGTLELLRAPRIALVLGNARYLRAPVLRNPTHDAAAVAEVRRRLKFSVTRRLDAGLHEMQAAIHDFVQTAEASAAVVLFYFAGHGVQLAWRNFLLPVDAEVEKADDLARQGVDLEAMLKGLRQAANPMNVVVLDACRDNPFAQDFRTGGKGLSPIDAPPHTLLAYATSPGNVASDGEGANGLYTGQLLRELQVPETRIEDVFKRVRLSVRLKSHGAQIPWESTSLEDDFWFLPPARLRALSDEERQREFRDELALWEAVRTAPEPAPLEGYLRRYPSGRFAELAQLQLDRVLARRGEKPLPIADAAGNPYSKGWARADTAYRVGDSYTYRVTDLDTHAFQRVSTATVTRITDSEVFFANGLVTDLLGNAIRAVDGRRFTPRQQLPLDYALGRRWHSRFVATTRKGDAEGIAELDFRIVARERVTVPAGTFDAFVIEGTGSTALRDRKTQSHLRRWMAPDRVRRPVAVEERLVDRGVSVIAERQELTAFRQA